MSWQRILAWIIRLAFRTRALMVRKDKAPRLEQDPSHSRGS
jgi:hypothetical protein